MCFIEDEKKNLNKNEVNRKNATNFFSCIQRLNVFQAGLTQGKATFPRTNFFLLQ